MQTDHLPNSIQYLTISSFIFLYDYESQNSTGKVKKKAVPRLDNRPLINIIRIRFFLRAIDYRPPTVKSKSGTGPSMDDPSGEA